MTGLPCLAQVDLKEEEKVGETVCDHVRFLIRKTGCHLTERRFSEINANRAAAPHIVGYWNGENRQKFARISPLPYQRISAVFTQTIEAPW